MIFRLVVVLMFVVVLAGAQTDTAKNPITRETIIDGEKIIGLHFSDAKRDSMIDDLKDQRENFENLRKVHLNNSVPPAMLFNPLPVGMKLENVRRPFVQSPSSAVTTPKNSDDLAFYSVGQLGALLKAKKITSVQLTTLSIERLKKYGPELHCVVTLMEDLAL